MDRVKGARHASEFGNHFVPDLEVLLSDPFYECRSHSALSLGKIRSSTSLPQLLNLLNDEVEEVRFFTAEALGFLIDENVIIPLLHILKDHSREAKRQAMISLSKQNQEVVIKQMMTWLTNLKSIDYEMEDREAISKVDIARGIMEAVVELDSSSILSILTFGLDSPDLEMQRLAAISVGNVEILECLPFLLSNHKVEDDDLRLAIIFALSKLDYPNKLEILIQHLEDTYDFIRQVLAETFPRDFTYSQAIPSIQILQYDIFVLVRSVLANSLRSPDYFSILEEMLSDPSDIVRKEVMHSLTYIVEPRSLELLTLHEEPDQLALVTLANTIASLQQKLS